jgi:hypothetical protein
MNRRHTLTRSRGIIILIVAATLTLPSDDACAQKFTKAKVAKVVNEVKLLTGTKASNAATPGSIVNGSTAVRTGAKSRTELQFPDESIVRLGSNSVFSFLEGKRDVVLEQGTLLMQVPKSLGRTNVRTASVSAAITGTTIMVEYNPMPDGSPGKVKIIVVEGTLEFSLNSAPGETVKLQSGEMAAFSADIPAPPQVFNIDLTRLVKTSGLMNGGMGQLPFLREVEAEVEAQQVEKSSGETFSTAKLENSGIVSRITSDNVIELLRSAARPPEPIQLPPRPNRPPPGGGPGSTGSPLNN